MTEQSNRVSKRIVGEAQSNFVKHEDLENGHTTYRYTNFSWENAQHEKKKAKRKARWRVFWNCLLAVGCGMALGGFFLLMLWIKDYFNI